MNLAGKAAVVWRRGPYGKSFFEVTTGPQGGSDSPATSQHPAAIELAEKRGAE